jgi:hypothetical protein
LRFQEKQAEYNQVDRQVIRDRLDRYATFWQIDGDVASMRKRAGELHKTAESTFADSDFAYVKTSEDGTKERHLRVTNAKEVKAAAEWLQKYASRIDFTTRHQIAGVSSR